MRLPKSASAQAAPSGTVAGFAASSVVACNTSRYHGILCAALNPPVGRVTTVNRIGEERGFRPSLLGHILIELLLDAHLHEQHPGKLEYYYRQVAAVDAVRLQNAVNLLVTKPTDKLAEYHGEYLNARFLFDYSDDDRLTYRVNRVMSRVKQLPLNDELRTWLPTARHRVCDRAAELLVESFSLYCRG